MSTSPSVKSLAARASLAVATVVLVLVGLLGQFAPTADAAPGPPLDCSGSTIYAVAHGTTSTADGTVFALQTSTVGGSSVASSVVTKLPAGGNANALGITRGGTEMYALNANASGGATIFGYSTATQTWTTYPGSAATSAVAGAVNPSNGIYYYASYGGGTGTTPGTATVYGFDTNTNTMIPGKIATINLPIVGSSPGNGDMAFDAAGNLYLLESIGTTVAISRVSAGSLPTTGSTNGVPVVSTQISTFQDPAAPAYDGIAFDNNGNLYVLDGATPNVAMTKLNPNTGTAIAGPTKLDAGAQGVLSVDLAACSTNPSLAVRKSIASRYDPADQFGLAVTGGGLNSGNTGVTTGSTTGLQTAAAGPVIAVSGTTYTVSESAASGNLANYTTTYDCIDTANGNASVASGNGQSFSLPFPATVAGSESPTVVCTFSNLAVTPSITLDKVVAETDLILGETLHYSYIVTNTGNVPLAPVTVADTSFTGSGTPPTVSCPAGATSLAPGAQVTCTATYVVTQPDVDTGTVDNTATASGTTPAGEPITSGPSSAVVPHVAAPAVTIHKSADPSMITAAGQSISYSYLVTNIGDVTLAPVTVDETTFSGTGTPPDVQCPGAANSLAPAASVTCTATYTSTQADVDAGTITNDAVAIGTPPTGPTVDSPPSQAVVTATRSPSLAIVKTASPTTITAAGQAVGYSFEITNTGNVTMSGVTVDETVFSGTGTPPDIDCPAGADSLAPGDSVTCTGSYSATQADVDSGTIKNTAVATGTPPDGPAVDSPPDHATVTADPAPAVTVIKSVDAPALTAAGQVLHYRFLVTNTGNVTLAPVTVAETAFSGTGTAPTVACPSGIDSLAPGDTVTCTGSYTVTQADLDAGTLTNTAIATGTPPAGPPVASPPSSTAVTSTPGAALMLLKTASISSFASAGVPVIYSYAVLNSGNVTLDPVELTDPMPGLSAISCPETKLAPGATETCTATYTTTLADMSAGSIDNTGTVTGTPPATPTDPHPTPVTATSSVSVPASVPPILLPGTADLQISKRVDHAASRLGAPLTYTLVVKNNGPATATGVQVTDTPSVPWRLGSVKASQGSCSSTTPITCTLGTIASGAQATITIVATPQRTGTETNTAKVTGTEPDPNPGNNVATAATKVTAVVGLTKTAPATARAGGRIAFRLVASNPGPVALKNIRVCDDLPAGLVYVSSTPRAKLARGLYCWTIATIPAHSRQRLMVTVRVLPGAHGRITNRATVTGAGTASATARRTVRVATKAARAAGVTG